MKNNLSRKRFVGRMSAVGLCVSMAFCTGMYGQDSVPAARSIMEGVNQQDTSHDVMLKANFQIFDKNGQSTKKDFILRRIGSVGDSKTLVVFTGPKEIRGVALLSINQPGAVDRQYVYTPATDRVRPVAPQERSARFIGTDFSFEEIGDHVLDDFNYSLVSPSESIDGHPCFKVEAIPVDPSRSQYKYIYYWVGKDIPVVLHAEMYDAQGKEVRVLHATDIKEGRWYLGCAAHRDSHRSRMEQGLSSRLTKQSSIPSLTRSCLLQTGFPEHSALQPENRL